MPLCRSEWVWWTNINGLSYHKAPRNPFYDQRTSTRRCSSGLCRCNLDVASKVNIFCRTTFAPWCGVTFSEGHIGPLRRKNKCLISSSGMGRNDLSQLIVLHNCNSVRVYLFFTLCLKVRGWISLVIENPKEKAPSEYFLVPPLTLERIDPEAAEQLHFVSISCPSEPTSHPCNELEWHPLGPLSRLGQHKPDTWRDYFFFIPRDKTVF